MLVQLSGVVHSCRLVVDVRRDCIAFRMAVASSSQFPIPCFLVQHHAASAVAALHLHAEHLS
jgi:primosomal replication protein N